MRVTSKEQAWIEANKLFPTDYEKDEASSLRAGYDVYRHHTLNYYNRICDLGNRLEVLTGEYGEEVTNIWIDPPVEEFAVEIISRGSYIDEPFKDGTSNLFIIEAITLRLNWVAFNEWNRSRMKGERECYEDGEAGDREWEEDKKEFERRGAAWREKIINAIGVTLKPDGESIVISQAHAEVFTAVRIEKI